MKAINVYTLESMNDIIASIENASNRKNDMVIATIVLSTPDVSNVEVAKVCLTNDHKDNSHGLFGSDKRLCLKGFNIPDFDEVMPSWVSQVMAEEDESEKHPNDVPELRRGLATPVSLPWQQVEYMDTNKATKLQRLRMAYEKIIENSTLEVYDSIRLEWNKRQNAKLISRMAGGMIDKAKTGITIGGKLQ